MPPLAPVEAGLADRTARVAEGLRIDLQRLFEEALALRRQFDVVLVLAHELALPQAVEHLHAEVAGEVIVADPGAAQRRVLRPGAHPQMAGAGGQPRKAFQHAGNVGIGKPIIAMAALLFLFDQAASLELREMRTRGLRRDAGFLRQFGCGERAAVHQRGQHVGAGGVADEGGDHGDIGTCFHCSMIAEALVTIKGVEVDLVIPGWCEAPGPESRDSLMRNCTSWFDAAHRPQ